MKDLIALMIRAGVKIEIEEDNVMYFVGRGIHMPTHLFLEMTEIYHADW